jgi:hypothetical protein
MPESLPRADVAFRDCDPAIDEFPAARPERVGADPVTLVTNNTTQELKPVRNSHNPKRGPMQDRGRMAAQVDIAERGIDFARAFAAATSFSSEWFTIGYREHLAAHREPGK